MAGEVKRRDVACAPCSRALTWRRTRPFLSAGTTCRHGSLQRILLIC